MTATQHSAVGRSVVGASEVSHARVSEMQRARLLAGAVGALDELGYERATVAHITSRARVSRRTFYELFASRDECLAAVLDETVAQIAVELAAAGLDGLPWRERIRTGLWTVLCFLDRESVLARACVVQAPRAGAATDGRRRRVLAQLASAVDEGRAEGPRGRGCPALTAEGLVGAAFTIVHARLQREDAEPLAGLTGELMALIVLPYLGPAAARREQARPAPAPVTPASGARAVAPPRAGHPFEELPVRLTYRTARVLEAVAELGARGSNPSNRTVAACAGVADPGQISKLLRRLERVGLLANTGGGHLRGEANAWVLTPEGERVARGICLHGDRARRVA